MMWRRVIRIAVIASVVIGLIAVSSFMLFGDLWRYSLRNGDSMIIKCGCGDTSYYGPKFFQVKPLISGKVFSDSALLVTCDCINHLPQPPGTP